MCEMEEKDNLHLNKIVTSFLCMKLIPVLFLLVPAPFV